MQFAIISKSFNNILFLIYKSVFYIIPKSYISRAYIACYFIESLVSAGN